jgi:hypothetical protein
MHTHRCGLTLSVVVCLLVLVRPAPAQQIPPGYDLLTDPRVSGALLVNSRPGSGGATALMQQSLSEVRPFFGQMRLLGAIADKTNDQRVELLFAAIVRGSMVQGLGVATTEPGRGTVGYAFDSPQTIAQTLPALLGLAGTAGQDPTRGLNWQVRTFPDGSGQMELPDGWQFTFANKGMVAANGPHGEIERGVASPVMSRAGAARLGATARQLPMPVLDPTDPVSALAGVWEYVAAASRQAGRPAGRILRVIEAAPASLPMPGLSQAAYVDFEFERGGGIYRALALAVIGAMGPDGQWLFYQTYVAAPAQSFAQSLPVLVRIWNSAVTARHVVQERLDNALANLQQAGEIWRQTTQARQRSIERSHADWTEAIRGTRIIRDTRTGAEADADLGYARDIVRKLNEGEPGRYREVPRSELVR